MSNDSKSSGSTINVYGTNIGDNATFNGDFSITVSPPQPVAPQQPAMAEKIPVNVFISYRRSVSLYFAKQVKEHLQPHIDGNIFLDFDSLGAGAYPEQIFNELRRSHVTLLLVSNGTFEKIHEPEDWVAREIKESLKRTLIPVLQGNTTLPSRWELPEDIQPLVAQQATRLYEDFFDAGIQKILTMIRSR